LPGPRTRSRRCGMSSQLIRLENIHKTYRMGSDLVSVLRGVDLVVNDGEFVAIMGASGSGKSTLLHIAGALDRPDRIPTAANGNGAAPKGQTFGEVYFREKKISNMGRWSRHRMRNHEFGFVFQFYHLLPELNVLENVLLPAMVNAPFYLAFVHARPRKERALELLDAFVGFQYPNEIGPGVYDIHSPRVPTVEEMENLIRKAADLLPVENLWVNPDCGLKTRGWTEVKTSLVHMVSAAQNLRRALCTNHAKTH